MNLKNLLIGVFVLSFIVFSFSSVSAELSFNDFNEFFQDNVTQLTITIHQSESQAKLYLNTEGTSFDSQNISCNNLNITSTCELVGTSNVELNFKVSDLLNGVNGGISIENGAYYPQFDNLSFSSDIVTISLSDGTTWVTWNGPFTSLIDRMFNDAGIPLNSSSSIPEFNDYLAQPQNQLSIASDRNIKFTKEGNDYTLWNDQGYEDISNETLGQIRDIINKNIESITIQDLLNKAIPIINQTSAGSGDVINSLLNGVYLNYTVGATDLSSVKLKDGTYDVPVFIQKDNTTFTKHITLILQGIENKETDVPVNENYTPLDPEVAYYLIGVNGIGDNIVNVSLFDDSSILPSNNLPSNVNKVIKYMEISVVNLTTGTIDFKVPVADVSNPSLLNLYVLEGSTWTQLPTTLKSTSGGFYEFESTTPHFSNFMIMETLPVAQTTTSSGGGGGGRRTTSSVPSTSTNPPAEIPTAPPIEATPPNNQPTNGGITGGAIFGELGTGGTLIIITFVVSVVVLMVVLRIRKKMKRKGEWEKLNEKSDRYGI